MEFNLTSIRRIFLIILVFSILFMLSILAIGSIQDNFFGDEEYYYNFTESGINAQSEMIGILSTIPFPIVLVIVFCLGLIITILIRISFINIKELSK
jgi:hypothetical protein